MMTWQSVCADLLGAVPPDLHGLWIAPLTCGRFDDQAVELHGPDRFFCAWVTEHFLLPIKQALTSHGLGMARVTISVNEGHAPFTVPSAQGSSPAREQLTLPSIDKTTTRIRTLNPRYLFDEFVVGPSNDIAFYACQGLAAGDQTLGQCLYISAGTGLGKSHLTHAVAHHLLAHNPRVRLNYLTAQQLTSDMVRSLQTKQMEAFKERYQGADILLMEDMHSLAGRVKTQEELTSMLDVLMECGKTVIFTGARAPRDIEALSPGLQSRLACGLVTEIAVPELVTRIRIVQRKAEALQLPLPEELAEVIAQRARGDVRQISSVLIGLKAKTSLRRVEPDLEMVNEALAALLGRRQMLTPEAIRDYVASQFNLTGEALLSKCRKKEIAFPRQVCMYLARKHTSEGLGAIGKAFNRDHSTVVHSIRVITEGMHEHGTIRGQVELLDKRIRAQFLGG